MATKLIQPGGMLDSVLRLWWIVAAAAIALSVAAAAFSLSQPKVVPASGQIALTAVRSIELESTGTATAGRSRVADESSRVLSAAVIEPAAAQLGATSDEVRASVTARPREEGAIILVDARTPTAAASSQRVNAVIAAYETSVRSARQSRVAELTSALDQLMATETIRVTELNDQLEEIDSQLLDSARAQNPSNTSSAFRNLQASSSERIAVATELNASQQQIRSWDRRKTVLAADLQTFDAGIDFIREANGASGPTEPNLVRNTVLGLVLGLTIGAAAAWSLNSAAVEAKQRAAPAISKPSSVSDGYPLHTTGVRTGGQLEERSNLQQSKAAAIHQQNTAIRPQPATRQATSSTDRSGPVARAPQPPPTGSYRPEPFRDS